VHHHDYWGQVRKLGMCSKGCHQLVLKGYGYLGVGFCMVCSSRGDEGE